MRTVDKALTLLDVFTTGSPEAGLSEIARISGIDKATTLRMLSALTRHGLLEQHPETRKYRLGPTVLKLARVREASFPTVSLIQPMLERLASETGETAHASMVSGAGLMTIGIAEPQRTTRVHLDPAQHLPFHATASGIACLAFAARDETERVLRSAALQGYTDHTPTSVETLRRQVEEARRRGFAVAARTFEDEVIGIAAPIFDWSGHANGAIAVASIATRLSPDKERSVAAVVVQAAIEVTRALGAEPHPDLLKAGEGQAA